MSTATLTIPVTADQQMLNRRFSGLADSMGADLNAAEVTYTLILANGADPVTAWHAMDVHLHCLAAREGREALVTGRGDLWAVAAATDAAIAEHNRTYPL